MGLPMARRSAGILLHPTSLPSRFGIGDLGPGASAFLTWAAAAGQSVWQMLPLGPTTDYNSPYQCLSAFAGNPMLIAPSELLEEGFLPAAALKGIPEFAEDRVDFGAVATWKDAVLRRSWSHFRRLAPPLLREETEAFRRDPAQSGWLEDWALYSALKQRLGGSAWQEWDPELRGRQPGALASARRELAEEIDFHCYVQFLFLRQWNRVRAEASRRGVALFGDVPIYVALDSADVWANPRYFSLDEQGQPTAVAGVPPDYFSTTGQLWGNPLYRWDRLAEDGFSWWVERLRMAFRLTDIVRVDHFRGFAGYWAVPASEDTAVNGRWLPAPGAQLFAAIRATLGDVAIVAEDLGVITPDVVELRTSQGFPGMKVLQFGFGEIDSDHLPHRWDRDTVAYTGTHDNDTTRGWFEKAAAPERRRALSYLGATPESVHWGMTRAIYTSVAELAVAPLQDVFGLGGEARMNFPGTAAGNWGWRARRESFTPELAARLRELAELSGRFKP
jgi:4-alpha-glucanotransferase